MNSRRLMSLVPGQGSPKPTILLIPRNHPQRSHKNDIRDRKYGQEQQCPFRSTLLEDDPGEIRRHLPPEAESPGRPIKTG